MHHQVFSRRAARLIGTLAIVTFQAACAGEDIPTIDPELRSGLAVAYTDAASDAPRAAGGGGSGGVAAGGGRAAAGAAGEDDGRASGAGGSSAGEASAGAAGSAMVSSRGGSSTGAGGGEASAAGSGAGEPSGPPACDGFAILAANCGTGGCHGAGSNLGNFAESESIARSFAGREGPVCAGQGFVIDPEDPPASLMLLKLSEDPPCGQPMPLGGALDDADIACIEDWIGSL